MGLDVLIENKRRERKTCVLSRQFSRELIDLSEHKNESIIYQLFKFYELGIGLIESMNVWDVEKEIWASSITKLELEARYTKAWQPVRMVLNNLISLKEKVEETPNFLKELEYKNEIQKKYFYSFNKAIKDKNALKSFRSDIETFITYLKTLNLNDEVKFHYY